MGRPRREEELGAFRPKAREKLAALLEGTLDEGQRTRLRQLERQREGLRDGGNWEPLQLMEEQRRQFLTLIQQAQGRIQPWLEEAEKSGILAEVRGKVITIRDTLEADLQARLTEAQRKVWRAMLGKPMDPAALFNP